MKGDSYLNKTLKKILNGIRWFIIGLFVLILIMILFGFVMLFMIIKDAPPINPQNIETMLDESSFIYDSSGIVTEKIQTNQYRTIVPVEQVPENLLNAFIAIEDERFLEHKGVDYKRLAGVTLKGLQDKQFTQGASTITMQLSKNLFTSSERSIERKVTDMYYAIEMEKQLSKTEILNAYVNTVFLGGDSNGVQAASKSYFNKDVSELNLAECAMLAGVTQYPTRYIPFKTEDISIDDDVTTLEIKLYPSSEQREVTADEMTIYQRLRDNNMIDDYEFILLKKGTLYAQKGLLNEKSVERMKVVLYKMLELGMISNEEYQEALNTKIVIDFPPRINSGISSYFNDVVRNEAINILVQLGNSPEKARDMLRTGGLRIYSTMNTNIQKILEDEFSKDSNFPGTYVDEDGVIQPQAAMVIIDQHTGYVVALIGGREQAGQMIFNRALSPRQPGSSIKPLAVYMPAIEKGATKDTIVSDNMREDKSSPTGYWPRNVDRVYRGDITYQTALNYSSNVAAVRIMESLASTRQEAINISIRNLENLGISTIVKSTDNPRVNDENLSLALGGMTKGITPLEMTTAYTSISNLGKIIVPTFITKIENSRGEVIYEHQPIIRSVINEYTAYELTEMLVSVVYNGWGNAAKLNNSIVAGKTGTTSDAKDFWFAGFTPYYTAALWLGSDNPKELQGTSSVAARFWKNIMDRIHQDLPQINFETPKGKRPVTKEDLENVPVEEEPPSVAPNETEEIGGLLFEETGDQNTNENEQNSQGEQTPAQDSTENNTNPEEELPPDITQPADPVIEDIPPSDEAPIYEDIPPDTNQENP